jgi:hypothetical protein
MIEAEKVEIWVSSLAIHSDLIFEASETLVHINVGHGRT